MNVERLLDLVNPTVREHLAIAMNDGTAVANIDDTVAIAVSWALRYLDADGLIDVRSCDNCDARFVFDDEDDNLPGGDHGDPPVAYPTLCGPCVRESLRPAHWRKR